MRNMPNRPPTPATPTSHLAMLFGCCCCSGIRYVVEFPVTCQYMPSVFATGTELSCCGMLQSCVHAALIEAGLLYQLDLQCCPYTMPYTKQRYVGRPTYLRYVGLPPPLPAGSPWAGLEVASQQWRLRQTKHPMLTKQNCDTESSV